MKCHCYPSCKPGTGCDLLFPESTTIDYTKQMGLKTGPNLTWEELGELLRRAAAEGIRVGRLHGDGSNSDSGIAYQILKGRI